MLIHSSTGDVFRIAITGGIAEQVEMNGARAALGNGFAPNGEWWASGGPEVSLAMADGSDLHQLTHGSPVPFRFHTWSPDSRWLAGVRRVGGNTGIYRISFDGCEDQRLTAHPGIDDAPDYSADRRWIYFSSDRGGRFAIWRMPITGAGDDDRFAQQVTNDDWEDLAVHPSPDGRWLLLVSRRTAAATELVLRLAEASGHSPIRVLESLEGGAAGIFANSWSPDSKQFAWIAYRQ